MEFGADKGDFGFGRRQVIGAGGVLAELGALADQIAQALAQHAGIGDFGRGHRAGQAAVGQHVCFEVLELDFLVGGRR